MDENWGFIGFLDGWFFRPQKDVQGYCELCRPDGEVACMVPSDLAHRIAAVLAHRTGVSAASR